MKKPLVSVVVLNYNGINYTLKCIDSIKKNAFKDYEIIVVDNGSEDNSVELLNKTKGIKLIENKKNTGFAEGNNIGVRESSGKYICLLNNDTLVDKNWLLELVKAIKSDKNIAVCNPKFFDKYDDQDYKFKGYGTISLFHAPIFLPNIDKHIETCIRSLTASGSAFYKKEIMGEPFDADYFAYAEDAHLGWRANLMGYKVVHVPKSTVKHEGGATAKKMKVKWDHFFVMAERNKLMNLITMYSPWTLIRILPFFIAYTLFSSIYDLKHMLSRAKAHYWIISHLGEILKKRTRMQALRKVPDSKIIEFMSCKIYDEKCIKNPIFKAIVSGINMFFYVYCMVLDLRTIEFQKGKVT